MFVTFKKKTVLIVIFCLIFLFSAVTTVMLKTEYVSGVPKAEYTVIIDAGHGGRDGGSSGRYTGIKESELNLTYALNIANQLKNMGIGVILTRKGESQLGDPHSSNKKRSDMQAREKIINSSTADLVVSIHMNTFPLQSCYGAQAFYRKGNEEGRFLADSVQKQFISLLKSPKKITHPGDYYIVNCTTLPAIIVECGYLTNEKEERLLQTKDYQNKVCYAILCGIMDFLNEK